MYALWPMMAHGAVVMMDSLLLYKILKNRTGAEVSASGNPAIMSDTLKNNPMNEMKVFGWSKQETTTGAQLWDEDNAMSGYILADGTVQNANKTNNEMIGDYQKVSGNNITLSYSVTVPETITSQSLWFAISCYDSENIILNEEIKQEIGKYVDVEIPLLIPDGTDSIYFTITCNNCSVAIKNIQIEEGGYTSYEPYHEPQSLSISTPTGLQAIPVDSDGNYTDADGQQWIADYVDLKRGKYVQNICDLPLKDINLEWYTWGVNNIASNGTGFYAYVTKYARVGNAKTLATICRHNIDTWGGRKVGCSANVNNSYITISLYTSDLDDASDNTKAIASFKKIVEQTDAHVLYVRADPIERDLTSEEIQAYKNLVTYAGTTIVENDAECYMEVSAGGGDSLRAKKLALILGE